MHSDLLSGAEVEDDVVVVSFTSRERGVKRNEEISRLRRRV